VRLQSERFFAEFLDPRDEFESSRVPVEVRWDPLTGQSARLLPPGSIPPPEREDLAALAGQTRPNCPFCGDAIEQQTPRFPAEISVDGRIRCGAAVLFPNLVPYAKWSSVSVYSTSHHLLPIEEITPVLLANNLRTQVAFARAVAEHDPTSSWVSIDANQMPASGSSIFHPHLQGTAHPTASTVQRLLAELPPGTIEEYVKGERHDERHISSRSNVDWLASFAPIGPGEVRAFIVGAASPVELDDATIDEMAFGITAILRVYADLGYQGFNLALLGAPPGTAGYMLNLRMVARAYFGPLARSDAMWSKRLHWEAATDLIPEEVAALARAKFVATRL
jgi:UDPglucose--hexose-1-phosphate uridylyltransferase